MFEKVYEVKVVYTEKSLNTYLKQGWIILCTIENKTEPDLGEFCYSIGRINPQMSDIDNN